MLNMRCDFPLVLIKGAGDLASGVGLRLHRAGFPVVMTETAHPLAVRRRVSFAEAVYAGSCQVEEVTARLCKPEDAPGIINQGDIPVLVDPQTHSLVSLQPFALVDAIMAKRNTGARLADAPLVVALGPGFHAGVDCHAVIETNRGHNLGRVLWQGSAEPDTGQPGEVPGAGSRPSRVLRAPAAGSIEVLAAIGDPVQEGDTLVVVRSSAGMAHEVRAPFAGVLRGIIHGSVQVETGMKIGDVDPRAQQMHCFTVSDKALAIGGGVLEAILQVWQRSQVGPGNTQTA